MAFCKPHGSMTLLLSLLPSGAPGARAEELELPGERWEIPRGPEISNLYCGEQTLTISPLSPAD